MKFILLILSSCLLVSCTDDNKNVAKSGLSKYCQYDLQESFEVLLYTSELPADDLKLIEYEMSSIIMSEIDYENALLEIQDNCCFHERKHPTNLQFRIFVNEEPDVAKVSCLFDVFNKSIVYIYRRWENV
ncbi:hypothetical protein [Alteromonas sp. KUL49]|uniref:hypothetical protein n=1 Tax=Alteromonas sp. KUL49 TaxID=2480798 RepID=UPI00102EF962|nr:hypothetical protein [Alteromonas sp. KUL49]TAP40952.1 hypothetical protein EYS00_07550 [Alteromonas sp. KUL49]GEA11134.1 hypothetical protein KUL49_15090 [Alteromonas sp. KUL49]